VLELVTRQRFATTAPVLHRCVRGQNASGIVDGGVVVDVPSGAGWRSRRPPCTNLNDFDEVPAAKSFASTREASRPLAAVEGDAEADHSATVPRRRTRRARALETVETGGSHAKSGCSPVHGSEDSWIDHTAALAVMVRVVQGE
jgi:hypothetical protein